MYELKNISKSFGKTLLFHHLDIQVPLKGITCILGPSGCGKTSLLKIMAGLDKDFTGDRSSFDHVNMSFVFQEPRLLPWLTVFENLDYVLDKSMPLDERKRLITLTLKKVGLEGNAHHYPGTLSGGMKQRVSLARALAHPHEILFLDEPFQGLDIDLKSQLMDLLKDLLSLEDKAVVMITHDPEEAAYLADCIVKVGDRPMRIVDYAICPIKE